jgi:hypothetical protein
MQTASRHRQWLATRNLPAGTSTSDQAAVIYCLIYLALRPHEVPNDIIVALVEVCPLLRVSDEFH